MYCRVFITTSSLGSFGNNGDLYCYSGKGEILVGQGVFVLRLIGDRITSTVNNDWINNVGLRVLSLLRNFQQGITSSGNTDSKKILHEISGEYN